MRFLSEIVMRKIIKTCKNLTQWMKFYVFVDDILITSQTMIKTNNTGVKENA